MTTIRIIPSRLQEYRLLPPLYPTVRLTTPAKTAFVARALLVVLLGSSVGNSFAPYALPSFCSPHRWIRPSHPVARSKSGLLADCAERARVIMSLQAQISPSNPRGGGVEDGARMRFWRGCMCSARGRRTFLEVNDGWGGSGCFWIL